MYAYAHAYAGIHVYNILVVSLPTPYILVILVILVIIWPWASWRRGSPSGGWINEGRAVNDNVDLCSSTVPAIFRCLVPFTYVKLYSTRMSAYVAALRHSFLLPLRAELTILKKSIDQL